MQAPIAVFGAAIVLRAVFLLALRENYDLASFRLVAEILERGGDLYRETDRYNYAPLWAFVLRGLHLAAALSGIAFLRLVGFFLLAVDGLSAVVLFRICRDRGASPAQARLAALLFFANPVSVLSSSYLAAFDNVSLLFLLLAVWFAAREPPRTAGVVASLAASLLVKHVTIFHPLLLLGRREAGARRFRTAAALVPYAVFFASFLPFWSSRDAIWRNVFLYRSLAEPYGTDPLRFLRGVPHWSQLAIFLAASLAAVFLLRRVEFARACLLLFLVVLIFSPGIVQYYFVWPIALGALFPSLGYLVYTVMVSLFLIHSPDALAVELPHLPGWSGPWWALVFWLLWEIRRLQRAVRLPAAASPR